MKKKNIKIIAIAIMSLVILAGIVVVGIFGFNKELRYGQGQVINVYVEQMVDVTNIKKLVNECLAGKINMVQTVEIYQDYVTIKAKEITINYSVEDKLTINKFSGKMSLQNAKEK